mmetsp:Transcript_57687/g.124039  ORF Transcript_57687/g.124039 Transcript_57687/m.124039 type:complete len:281 (-) Transcript_57687:16-858(-)
MLKLGLQRSVSVIMAHNTWCTHRDIGHGVDDSGVAFSKPTIGPSTIRNIVNPRRGRVGEIMAGGPHKSFMLTRIPIVAAREGLPLGWVQRGISRARVKRIPILLLPAIDSLHHPPITLQLIQTRKILYSVSVCGKAFTIIRVDRQALVGFSSTFNQLGEGRGGLSINHLTQISTAGSLIVHTIVLVGAIHTASQSTHAGVLALRGKPARENFLGAVGNHAPDVGLRAPLHTLQFIHNLGQRVLIASLCQEQVLGNGHREARKKHTHDTSKLAWVGTQILM